MKQILSNDIINQYMPILTQCPLFNNLGETELRSYLNNAKVIVHSYKKNEFVALSGDPMEGIGVILEGSTLLTRENVMGQRVIMANLDESAIFGEALLFSKHPLWPATIKAVKATKIMFIPLETFIETLPDCHQCQTKILSNLLQDLSEKAILLTRKVHYLTLKGMREKIFAYFTDLYNRQQSTTIHLPHNREQMAEVLNVSRTALSRELGRLRNEGIIDITGRNVTLKNIDEIEEFGFNGL
ncbi:Crp/Fnr family transcriptional regulator [Veillonella sp. AS16]|uniref:Crp/Fnr family transcriptional regulator n=1 Tax=Veillonella sp. AS16 TaxID=936589 RepID=UPI0003E1FC40|nr:Crp/Fnr family transcriptional regulator [Veillonella sp. AS16]ETS93934.1 cyclic nucleotide-binding domain protein [Veillonella sp. AS16]